MIGFFDKTKVNKFQSTSDTEHDSMTHDCFIIESSPSFVKQPIIASSEALIIHPPPPAFLHEEGPLHQNPTVGSPCGFLAKLSKQCTKNLGEILQMLQLTIHLLCLISPQNRSHLILMIAKCCRAKSFRFPRLLTNFLPFQTLRMSRVCFGQPTLSGVVAKSGGFIQSFSPYTPAN